MAKGMTKTQLIRFMAEKLELTNKQSALFFSTMAETAVKETKKNGEFTIPGIGKLVKAERKARIGRNPQTGEAIKIKAKTVVKFRIAKAAKDTIAPVKETAATTKAVAASLAGSAAAKVCPLVRRVVHEPRHPVRRRGFCSLCRRAN